ncbi:MAG TPA: hypothetical protein VMG10_35645 [Gemmataceae bacterium]|nr:hypothetical protein [Gemmataceae bacterium]
MSSAEKSSAFPIKILLLVLGIVGVVVLMIVLGCGGLIYLVWTKVVPEFQSLQTSADAFVQDIRNGQLPSAYGRTSTGFQARQSFPQFQALVTQYPALRTYTSLTNAGIHISSTPGGTRGTVRYTAIGPNNSLSFTLILVQQNGQWRVDSFTVP